MVMSPATDDWTLMSETITACVLHTAILGLSVSATRTWNYITTTTLLYYF